MLEIEVRAVRAPSIIDYQTALRRHWDRRWVEAAEVPGRKPVVAALVVRRRVAHTWAVDELVVEAVFAVGLELAGWEAVQRQPVVADNLPACCYRIFGNTPPCRTEIP